MAISVFGNDQQAGRILIDAVHQSRTIGQVAFHQRHFLVLEVIGQSIDQGTRMYGHSGMYHHSRRFVYHHQVIVFVANIKRDIFRFDGPGLLGRFVERNGDHLVGPDLVIGFHLLPVHQDGSIADGILDFVPGKS